MDVQHSMSTGDQKERRKEQNRAAQRAFRERKERFVKELQLKIKDMEAKHKEQVSGLISENQILKEKVKQMEAEIYTLKGAAMAFDVSIHKLREANIQQQQQPTVAIREQRSDLSPLSPPNEDDAPSRKVNTPSHSASFFASPRKSPIIRDSLFNSIDSSYEEHENFAQPETKRFDHTPDPITLTGAKLIPYTQIWEKLSEHPNFDEFDMNELCEELKKKARCSGTGPVIPESELNIVLTRMDAGNK
ncbi:hypothetical protein K501DRAFT_247886 [Backusella circina FSU 941]|nr:hypothetical protein K501DRAFT_247886 [Backusella circina FSU 941]